MVSVQTFTSVIDGYFPEPQASLLKGMLFGVSLYSKTDFYSQLKAVGLLHLVVLSGMNITLLASVVSVITSSLGKKISLLLTSILVIIFIAFVGIQAPIVRAGIMGIITYVGIALGRKTIAIYTLGLSLIVIALIWPEWLGTVSLQLSFGATLGIILFGTRKEGVESELKKELRTSLAAQVFTAPLIFIYFRQVSLISPIANVLAAPMVAPIMIMGFITVFLGKVSFAFGFIPAVITQVLLSYLITVVELLSRIPFAYIQF